MNVATMLPDGLHRVICKRWDSQFPTILVISLMGFYTTRIEGLAYMHCYDVTNVGYVVS